MRKPTLQDGLNLARVCHKMRVDSVLPSEEVMATKDANKIGVEFISTLITRITEAEAEIVDFFAGLFECSGQEVLLKPIDEMVAEFTATMTSDEMKSFFKRAGDWMSPKLKTSSTPATEPERKLS